MSWFYQYNNDNVFYLGEYDACDDDVGWYAASPSNMEAGEEPNDGPFETEEEAMARAEELAIEEQELNEKLDSPEYADEATLVVDSLTHKVKWYCRKL